MSHSVKETITIGWCDNGVVEGRFASGVINTIIEAPKLKINIDNTIRVNGNQIARQRQSLFDYWADLSKSEWLLWVDSDIIINQDIVKIKAVNRVASGISRYFDINDPTGRSSSINLFADDGAIYRDTFTTTFTFGFNTKNEIYGIVKSKIEPLISSESVRDFYYEIFERIKVGNLGVVWTSVATVPNQTSGYFSSITTNAAVPVSGFTQSTLKYIKSKALVKFVPPEGKYFAPNNTIVNTKSKKTKDYIWAEVVYVSGDGSNLGKGTDDRGIGLVAFSSSIPSGAIPLEIIPVFVTDIPFSFEVGIPMSVHTIPNDDIPLDDGKKSFTSRCLLSHGFFKHSHKEICGSSPHTRIRLKTNSISNILMA
jgi:hypothetical protein